MQQYIIIKKQNTGGCVQQEIVYTGAPRSQEFHSKVWALPGPVPLLAAVHAGLRLAQSHIFASRGGGGNFGGGSGPAGGLAPPSGGNSGCGGGRSLGGGDGCGPGGSSGFLQMFKVQVHATRQNIASGASGATGYLVSVPGDYCRASMMQLRRRISSSFAKISSFWVSTTDSNVGYEFLVVCNVRK